MTFLGFNTLPALLHDSIAGEISNPAYSEFHLVIETEQDLIYFVQLEENRARLCKVQSIKVKGQMSQLGFLIILKLCPLLNHLSCSKFFVETSGPKYEKCKKMFAHKHFSVPMLKKIELENCCINAVQHYLIPLLRKCTKLMTVKVGLHFNMGENFDLAHFQESFPYVNLKVYYYSDLDLFFGPLSKADLAEIEKPNHLDWVIQRYALKA